MKNFILLLLLLQLTKIDALWPLNNVNPYLTNVYKNIQLSGFGNGVKPLGFRQRLTPDAQMKPGYGRKLNGLLRNGMMPTLPSSTESVADIFTENSEKSSFSRRKTTSTSTITPRISTITTNIPTTTTTTRPTTTLKTTTVRTTTRKVIKKPSSRFYKPKYISLDDMSIAEKHKNALLKTLKSVLSTKNRVKKTDLTRLRLENRYQKSHNLAKMQTENLRYNIRNPSMLNPKKFGTLVVVNNNNNNNNLIHGLDPIELERFLRAHQDMTITQLLHSDITERLKRFFDHDKQEIDECLENERATGLSKKKPIFKMVDLRSKKSNEPPRYTYYPNSNGGVIVINNSNNNNNDYTIRKILSGEGINVNNNNEGVALNLPPEDIERLLKNAIIVNNDNNNNNAN